jgi:hypothetical protein
MHSARDDDGFGAQQLGDAELDEANGQQARVRPLIIDLDGAMRAIRATASMNLPAVLDAMASKGLSPAARFGTPQQRLEHEKALSGGRAAPGTPGGGGKRSTGARSRGKPSSSSSAPGGSKKAASGEAVPSTLVERLTRQVQSLRKTNKVLETSLSNASRALTEEKRRSKLLAARLRAAQKGPSDTPPSDGSPAPLDPVASSSSSSGVLAAELSRAHREITSLGQELRASNSAMLAARERASLEASRAEIAEAAARSAEAAAAAFETAVQEAEGAIERLVAPRPSVGDDVEVQGKASLSAVRGAVRWRRGRVVAVRRSDGGKRVLTVRLANGRVEQDVDEGRALLRVPAEAEEATRSEVAARATQRRSQREAALHGAAGGAGGGDRRRDRLLDGYPDEEEGASRGGGGGGGEDDDGVDPFSASGRHEMSESEAAAATRAAVRASLARGQGERLKRRSGPESDDTRGANRDGADDAASDAGGDGEGRILRELVRAGPLVSDAGVAPSGEGTPGRAAGVAGPMGAMELQLRWVSAVLERRCKDLATNNVRLRSRVAVMLREVGLEAPDER